MDFGDPEVTRRFYDTNRVYLAISLEAFRNETAPFYFLTFLFSYDLSQYLNKIVGLFSNKTTQQSYYLLHR